MKKCEKVIFLIANNIFCELSIKKCYTIRKLKKFLKKKFNIKKRFYLQETSNNKIFSDDEKLQRKNIKKIKEIQIIYLNKKNKASINFINEKLLKTISLVFKLFMKLDFQYFDRILETIKFANPKLFYYILLKKNTFINMIFSYKLKNIDIDKKFLDKKFCNFFEFFKRIFFTDDNNRISNNSNSNNYNENNFNNLNPSESSHNNFSFNLSNFFAFTIGSSSGFSKIFNKDSA